MSVKDVVVSGLEKLRTPGGAIGLGAASYVWQNYGGELKSAMGFGENPTKKTDKKDDRFSLESFVSHLKDDGFRLSRGYHFQLLMLPSIEDAEENYALSIMCDSISLPGYRAKTQSGRIYALDYEIATNLEQDPVWVKFNVDTMHKVEHYFMVKNKKKIFSPTTYEPSYKQEYQFNAIIYVTDQNFVPIYGYVLNNCMIRTVQNVSYGQGETTNTLVNIEIVYETIDVTNELNTETRELGEQLKKEQTQISASNQVKIGPFSADISAVNQAVGAVSKIPKWFEGPTKL